MYTLRLPIDFPEGLEIVGAPIIRQFKELTLKVERSNLGSALIIHGFENEERAGLLLRELEAGLIWVLLEADLAAKASFVPRNPVFPQLPETAATDGESRPANRRAFDGAFDASLPVIYQTDVSLGGFSMTGSMSISRGADQFIDPLLEWLAWPDRVGFTRNPKFVLATQLYAAHLSEQSTASKFLTLIMALEALCEDVPKPDKVRILMQKWEAELVDAMAMEGDEDAKAGFEALKRELSFRQGLSISGQLRQLVKRAIGTIDPDRAASAAKRATYLYRLRSSLVHDGDQPDKLGEALGEARKLVRDVLRGLAAEARGES